MKKIRSKQGETEKPKYNAFQNSVFMMELARKEKKKRVLVYMVLIALFEVATSILNVIIAPIILETIENQRSFREFILTVLLFILPLIFVQMMTAYFHSNTIWGRVDVRLSIVRLINEKFIKTSYPNTLKEGFQKKLEQAQYATRGNSEATEAIWETMTNLLKNSIGFIIYLFLLSVIDPLIISLVIITTITSFFINHYINSWGYRHRDEEAIYHKEMGFITDKINDGTLAKDIRLFGMRSWLENIYQSSFQLFKGFITRREKIYIWADVTELFFTFLRNGVAYFYLIHLVLNEGLPASSFLLLFTAIGGFTTWITGILSELGTLNKQSLDLSIIREFLEYPEPFLFEEGEELIPSALGKYQIELRNVSFSYEGSETKTLESVNLKISAGEKLAIVGINGAGKTTLIKLLCGYLDPTEGEVLLNGKNIKIYNRNDYYQLFSAVFQDCSIMAGSISQNVAQRVDNIEMDKMGDCLRKAGLLEKINGLPEGCHSKLEKWVYEDAIDLSGGQMQRLMLARALYKDGQILVLDEPTAALDPIAERDIYQAYDELTAGKMAIYISHRLASTKFCDRIILLDGNRIAEVGTHQELSEFGGKYTEMFDIQSKYYQENMMEAGGEDEQSININI